MISIMKYLLTLIFIIVYLFNNASAKIITTKIKLNTDDLFHYQAIRALSYAPFKGADINEVFLTLENIMANDEKSWHQNWYNIAERLNLEATKMLKKGHKIEAKHTLLRASNYYRAAEFFLRDQSTLNEAAKTFQNSKTAFTKALQYYPGNVELIDIPFADKKLPGYFVNAHGQEKTPLIILNTGFDGTAEELFFLAYEACMERNYNCLMFEGPGQGDALRKYHLPFRHDWENVITPVLDFIIDNKKNIDNRRIALIGISMGGYLVPRALAFENRIKLAVVNGGIIDFHAVALQGAGDQLRTSLNHPQAKEQINQAIFKRIKNNPLERWFFNHGMYSFHKTNPVDFLLETKKYILTNEHLKNIKAKVLVVDTEKDTLLKSQSKNFYQQLNTNKQFLEFKKNEGADQHCQSGALLISRTKIFNWIDENI